MTVTTEKRCPKCRSTSFETETLFKGPAEFCTVKNGVLMKPFNAGPAEEFITHYEPQHMDCVGVDGVCASCGHRWRFKGVLHAESIFDNDAQEEAKL